MTVAIAAGLLIVGYWLLYNGVDKFQKLGGAGGGGWGAYSYGFPPKLPKKSDPWYKQLWEAV